MDELDEIRKQKLRELQERQAAQQGQDEAAEEQAAQQEAAIERILQQLLDSEARERLTRIRMSRPEFAERVTHQLVALAQAGRIKDRLTDADLRQILEQLSPKDRDTTITRR